MKPALSAVCLVGVVALLVACRSADAQRPPLPPPVQQPAGRPCFNGHPHCTFWASQGECRRNPNWMLPNCAAACHVCQAGPQPPVPLPVPQQQPQPMEVGGGPVASAGGLSNQLPADPACPQVQVAEVRNRVVLPGGQYRLAAQRVGCATPAQPNNCTQNLCYHKRFRTADGSCNHFDNPLTGAAQTPFLRLLNANYEDGVNLMIGTSPNTRPPPRALTRFLMSSPKSLPSTVSSMVMSYGQFLMHDIVRNTLINTCECDTRGAQCANIPLVAGDRRKMPCIPFTRFIPMCGSGRDGRPRLPMNENTACIDASQIYGSDPTTQSQLRANAFLKTTLFRGLPFPPRMKDTMMVGDDRFDLFAGLTGFHVLTLRLHNVIVANMQRQNPRWNPERLYQEARKLVGALIQSITYNQFLPSVLGGKISLLGEYTGFKQTVDPQISTEFASAAARWHAMVQDDYPLCDSNFRVIGRYKFVDAAGSTDHLMRAGPDSIMRGMVVTPARRMSRLGLAMTEQLFDSEIDICAMNVQRGRDMGLKSYQAYRELCGLKRFTFTDWPEVPDPAVRKRVAEMYGSEENVELFIGGGLESPAEGSALGPTFACLYAEQFKRLRDGDRLWYENADAGFTEAQRATIKNFSLGKLLCMTGDSFTRVQRNVFLVDSGAQAVPCNQLPGIDFSLWRE